MNLKSLFKMSLKKVFLKMIDLQPGNAQQIETSMLTLITVTKSPPVNSPSSWEGLNRWLKKMQHLA